jgi:hypothetical protein
MMQARPSENQEPGQECLPGLIRFTLNFLPYIYSTPSCVLNARSISE